MRRSWMCRLRATVLLGCLLCVVVPRAMAQGPQRGPTHRLAGSPARSSRHLPYPGPQGLRGHLARRLDGGLDVREARPKMTRASGRSPSDRSCPISTATRSPSMASRTLDPPTPMIKQGITGLDNMVFVPGDRRPPSRTTSRSRTARFAWSGTAPTRSTRSAACTSTRRRATTPQQTATRVLPAPRRRR